MADQMSQQSKLQRLPPSAQLNLRGNIADADFTSAVKATLGLDLTDEPNKVIQGGDIKALWLSPDEWLIVAGEGQGDALVVTLEKALFGQHFAVNDLSDNRAIFGLSGPESLSVLMKCCEIDFHPRVFKLGDSVQTLLAKSQAIIEQTELSEFHIYVRNSYGEYVGGWLADALKEFTE